MDAATFTQTKILCGISVQKKMDEMHPYHPLYKSEANYHKNRDEAEMDMLRRTMGLGFPLKLQMERKLAGKVGHLPCITTSSHASLDALQGIDTTISYDDIFGQAEFMEAIPDLPFNAVNNMKN
ncbi:proteasome maturation protein-like [Eurytemora carolleeae]|uniref:proteasome maturation protein-like n=1 Tax=Eurytemora carolleeae TaxID=1294199 RepID=UPI000C78FAD7|nr:proteasome maturation protein-like [Eurytemora carolleeae]|eukprot:XP_023327647.1 proteasome maturation protein-like [Eurytemora affinis]